MDYKQIYANAEASAIAALNHSDAPKDDGYGCGTSFVTLKWGAFVRWAKKEGIVKKDGYYGWILDTNSSEYASATLSQEHYDEAFARALSSQGIHAFCHTYLT